MADWLSTAEHAPAPPGAWMSTTDHSSEAPGSDTGYPQLGPSPTMARVGNTIFGDLANAPARIMNFLSGHPLDDTLEAIRASTAARQVHKQRALAAYKAGDFKTAADQTFFGSVPFIGPALGAAADQWEADQKPEAVAHAVEILGPALADPAMNGLESEAAARAGAATTRGAQAVSTAAGGALKGAAKSSIQTIPYGRVNIPIPAPIVGAWAGGSAAAQFGLPRALGAAIGGGLPLVRGAIAGAREALATRMATAAGIEPEVLDSLAQAKFKKNFSEVSGAQKAQLLDQAKQQTATPPPTAPVPRQPAPAVPITTGKTMPQIVQEELGAAVATQPAEDTAKLDEIALGLTRGAKKYSQLDAAGKQIVDNFAQRSTTSTPGVQPPPEALAQLNSGVTTPTPSQIGKVAAAPEPAVSVQPPAAMRARFNTGVTVSSPRSSTNPRAAAQNLFNEMSASGSVPPAARPGQPYGSEQPAPDRFVQAARQARATNTGALADILHAGGVSSSDLPNVTADEWTALARAKGLGWPIGKPAQAAWTRDVIAALKAREGR
jgi:hypothetical protein